MGLFKKLKDVASTVSKHLKTVTVEITAEELLEKWPIIKKYNPLPVISGYEIGEIDILDVNRRSDGDINLEVLVRIEEEECSGEEEEECETRITEETRFERLKPDEKVKLLFKYARYEELVREHGDIFNALKK
ncbi:hypothetical protein A3L04_08940 [Thermococcus chitonophagus]|uniref:Uncharacterized protein n=1 Tax=Thermococcus chitonophagus TaxID=54262 RepID=A0A170SK32_9EURY|nr:hypothetical protein [Thermococcus chitonophagus]ASJ17184.1 hypothetical protein A3L04_08940 [Thermococcus chitonophagus]CUX77794.1 hypothetical protein CHITON_1015 [Thermococcus chitonophagus]